MQGLSSFRGTDVESAIVRGFMSARPAPNGPRCRRRDATDQSLRKNAPRELEPSADMPWLTGNTCLQRCDPGSRLLMRLDGARERRARACRRSAECGQCPRTVSASSSNRPPKEWGRPLGPSARPRRTIQNHRQRLPTTRPTANTPSITGYCTSPDWLDCGCFRSDGPRSPLGQRHGQRLLDHPARLQTDQATARFSQRPLQLSERARQRS